MASFGLMSIKCDYKKLLDLSINVLCGHFAHTEAHGALRIVETIKCGDHAAMFFFLLCCPAMVMFLVAGILAFLRGPDSFYVAMAFTVLFGKYIFIEALMGSDKSTLINR